VFENTISIKLYIHKYGYILFSRLRSCWHRVNGTMLVKIGLMQLN